MGRVLARDQSASLEDWQKLARTGEIVLFYNGRDRKKTGKIVRNCHFGRAVSKPLNVGRVNVMAVLKMLTAAFS